MAAEVRARWLAALPGADPGAAVAAFDDVAARHGEAHRRYHDLAHVAAVVRWVDRLHGEADDPAAVLLAGVLHDVVYDPRSATNEDDSAAYAERLLPSLGAPAPVVDEVARLVRTTADHVVDDGDRNGAVLSDADLSILGATPAAYASYVDAVRAEYAWVGAEGWRTGRRAVLAGLLDRPRLFLTDRARADLEDRARANLTAELAALG